MERKRTGWLPFIVCAVAASFYIYDYILRVMPEAMTHDLMVDFNIQAPGLGILASLFFWGYVPMQIPVGILFDKFSARFLLTITFLFSSLAVLLFGYTHSFAWAGVARFIMGFMTSFSFVGTLVVGAYSFRGKNFAIFAGLVQFLGCIGAILGIAPVAFLNQHLGRADTCLIIAVIGLVFTLLMWIVVRNPPKTKKVTNDDSAKRSKYRAAFLNIQTWWVGLFGFAIWSPATVFAVLWGVPYLHDIYHFSPAKAGSFISVFWITVAFGWALVAWFSKHFCTRRLPMVICSLIGILSSLGIMLFTHLSSVSLILLIILFGLGASGFVIAFGLIVDIQAPETVGAVVGFTNMAVILGGLILQPLAGFIIHHIQLQSTPLITGVPIYSHHAYAWAFSMMPLSFLLALISAFLIKETHCLQRHEY